MDVLIGRMVAQRAARALLLASVMVGIGTVGCATENKITKGPNFSLSHPDFWKVQSVASKAGEPTKLSIGRFSETVVNDGAGSDTSSIYESSQAEVDARIYTWPGVDDGGAGAQKVANLLFAAPELELGKQSRIATDKGECGAQFVRKYLWKGQTLEPWDLISKPGFRTIVIGTKADGVLTGVVTRVPTEQDAGLFCHNLKNMQTQLQLLLEGLTVTADAGAAGATPTPGGAAADPAKPAASSAAPTGGQ